jgi:hypothetical protein
MKVLSQMELKKKNACESLSVFVSIFKKFRCEAKENGF